MKKLLTILLCICFAATFFGCKKTIPASHQSEPDETLFSVDGTFAVSKTANAETPMYAVVLPPVKETVIADDGTALFTLSFQETDLILHNKQLEKKIADNLLRRTRDSISTASEIEAQARLDYPGNEYWCEYFFDISYTPTRLDHAVLSLFGNTTSYCGGPHPSLVTDSVNYDLSSGDPVFLDDILTAECDSDTLYQLILKSLEGRAADLYYDYADALGDRFTGELHSVQDWYFSRTGLCFHFPPYDIAPYSSGTIIAELPYSTLTGILKEKYFPVEPVQDTGSVYAETYIEDDSERFIHIADVRLCESGHEVLLYPDATVTDLRIESGTYYSASDQYIAVATVFASSNMNVGDAIHLTADLECEDSVLRVIYRSDQKEYSAFITYDSLGDSILLTND